MPEEPKNTEKICFDAVIKQAGHGGAYIEFPYDTEALFGTKGRVKVKAAFDGEPYRGSLVKMGGEGHILGILKSIREKIGKQPGDPVTVALELDEAPRKVEIPTDFHNALTASPAAEGFFKGLSYSHQREYVRWINGARRGETRQRRIAQAVEMLADSKTRP